MRIKHTTGLPCQYHHGHSSPQRHSQISFSAAYWLYDFCFLVFVISLRASLPAQLWRLGNCLAGGNAGTAWSPQLCLCVSILFVSNTGKRIRKVDRVPLLVCAKLSTWMAAQGTSADCSPFRQKNSQNSSSCVCEVGMNLQEEQHRGKEVPQGSCTPRNTFHPNYFLLFLHRSCICPLAMSADFSLTRPIRNWIRERFWREGAGCEHGKCVSKIISRLMQKKKKIFTLSILHSATAIFQSCVNTISVFIIKIIHTTVKVTCWMSQIHHLKQLPKI